MDFNPIPPTTMHVDINSCFATVEQQANPLLRGKPVVVAAYVKDYGCILAASHEAKLLGIKTGMRVREGKLLAPRLVVLPPDPPKYRAVNRQLLAILQSYTAHLSVESIDEIVMNVAGTPSLRTQSMEDIAREIKQRVKREIGEWITVSCGIAPNRYLAKVASNLQKPDGLVVITKENIMQICSVMQVEDFCGIKEGNSRRLRAAGITTPLAFFRASVADLKRAFRSVVGAHWWLRLHGYEDGLMYKEFEKEAAFAESYGEPRQKSFGQSYVLGTPFAAGDPRLWQILTQLVMKMGRRLRADGFAAYGTGVAVMFSDYTNWRAQEKKRTVLFTDMDFYTAMRAMLTRAPDRPVKMLAVFCYALVHEAEIQPSLFAQDNKKRDVTRVVDAIQDRFGDFIIHPARMLAMEQKVLDRIAFGGAEGLPDVEFHDTVTHEIAS